MLKFIRNLVLFILVITVILYAARQPLVYETVNRLASLLLTEVSTPSHNQFKLIDPGLKVGSKGDDVKILQRAISMDDDLYPEGVVSGYFGELTRQAVINFQVKYKLEKTGEVDSATADKFNYLYGLENRDYYLAIRETPALAQLQVNNQNVLPDVQEWGKARQLSEHTWTVNVGFDDRMATSSEIFEALNSYRQKHGSGTLTWDPRLANYAQTRASYFTSLGNLDEHAGFNSYLSDENNVRTLGFQSYGENSSFGYRLLGVHLIEWVYAADKPHNDNQLDPAWTHVGIGVDEYQTDLIFAADPL